MKILFLADHEDPAYWDYFKPDRLRDIDLIISCGDLDANYLEFLVTMTKIPVLYVRGNHDSDYDNNPPLGCISLEDRVVKINGLRILGLGGSMRYHPTRSDMFTESEMRRRIMRVQRYIWRYQGFDLMVTHAPAKGYGDLEDLPHRGFECFNYLLNKYHPKIMAYGHAHKEYSSKFKRVIEHPSGTKLINAWKSCVVEIDV